MTSSPLLPAPRPLLLLVDGSSYIYRAFHVGGDWSVTLPDGSRQPTGALRIMINMMQSLLREHAATHLACVFDAPGRTFRDDIYPDYKAHRPPMPDDLRSQIAPIHEVVRLLGWPVLAVEGVEADDVIGTLAQQAARQGMDVIVSSGDKDLSQLVNAHITIIDTMSGKRRDEAGVLAEFGVRPDQMIDYQTLVGDAVDNVPGVDKVGPKTAAKWLAQYGTLDALLAQADAIKGVVGNNLRAARDWLPTGRQLVTIKTDCDLAASVAGFPALNALARPGTQGTAEAAAPDAAQTTAPTAGHPAALTAAQIAALRQFYTRYQFRSLLKSLPSTDTPATHAMPPGQAGDLLAAADVAGTAGGGASGVSGTSGTSGGAGVGVHAGAHGGMAGAAPMSAPIPADYQAITTLAALDDWLGRIQQAPLTAIDTETTSLDAMQAQLVGISLCVQVGQAAYIPVAHVSTAGLADTPPKQLPLDVVLGRLRPWLEDASRPKLGQNSKYDRHVLANHGISVRGYVHDTMLQSYVLESHRPHGLESLALRYLGREGISYEQLCGKGASAIPFAQVPLVQAATYACEDADFCLHIHQILWPRIQAEAALARIYQLEMDTSDALWQMERCGVAIDAAQLARQSNELGARLVQLEQQAHALAGQPFNLGSPKQIGEIFFDKLGLPVIKKTATGKPSTDEEVLEKLAADYPLPQAILEYRGLAKLKNTYTDKLAGMAHPRTGRVHTTYAQAVAVTGRLASNEPNLQNIPVRTAEGRRVREAFVAPAGCVIASADYSQIELRIMAHMSEDPALIRAFEAGEDVHRATAAEIFGVAPEQVSSEQRRYAKVINFGLIYGMGSFGLAKALGIDNTAARNYIQRYFERYPGVHAYMEGTRELARTQGYVETILGRRLYLPDITSPNAQRRAGAERAAINAPMQGTAADLIKLSMVEVQRQITAQGRRSRPIMQVHDELVLEVPLDEQDWVRSEIPRIMASVTTLRVPLLAEIGLGANWEQAH